jgi:hypothetical protein
LAEKCCVNLFRSDFVLDPGMDEHKKNVLLNSLHLSLKMVAGTVGWATLPSRGVRCFADREETISFSEGGPENRSLIEIEKWSGKILEIRFHDGFVAQFEVIDNRLWLKIDPRQTVLVKGNEQKDADFNRPYYIAYCPQTICANRLRCPYARPFISKAVRFAGKREYLESAKEKLGVGCRFYKELRDLSSIVEMENRGRSYLAPWRFIYFKGNILDMPTQLVRVYRNRCLIESCTRLQLTNYIFSTLGSKNELTLPNDGNQVCFGKMFEEDVES